MNLNEAKAILKENNYVVEENKRETWRDYLNVYEDTHPKATFFTINDMIKEYIYEARFLGYNPDMTVELDKVDFEWITDEEIISNARKEACWT